MMWRQWVGRRWGGPGILAIAAVATCGLPAGARQDPAALANPDGPEVLARGPIHEAFASPYALNPAPGLIVPKPPPQTAIEEQPPAQKPEGADVEWIPGYWAWADDRNDYIWISGVWRDIPPGRQWVPGYWSQAQDGFRWTPGFWGAVAANGQFDYLPAPPPSQENGPNSPQPGDNYAWSPGSWVWQADRYVWQPGYWFATQNDWIWTPSSYVATPSGYLHNDGYWDYSLDRRGVPFAPVAFGPSFASRPNYAYTPSYVLPVGGLLSSLFIRPNSGNYYFGDYYGASGVDARSNYVPWFGYQQNHLGYDPLYASMSAQHVREPEWDRRLRQDYQTRVDRPDVRPAATFEGQRGRGIALAQPFGQWAANPEASRRFVPVGEDHRAELGRRQAAVQEFSQARLRQESQARVAPGARPEEARPRRLDLPRSPVMAASEPRFQSRGLTPPPSHPEQHQAFRPNFEGQPQHREPNPPAGRPELRPMPAAPRPNEVRPGAGPVEPHKEPRPGPEARPAHPAPAPPREGAEHPRPGRPR